MKSLFKSIGPALIVAAVVLGPGSILTSSKVGASFGLMGIPVLLASVVLMIAMVALAARLGVVYEKSVCDELAARLGRPVALVIGLILFTLIALFQSSNNIALVGGLESMVSEEPFKLSIRLAILVSFNLLILLCLYRMRNLYALVERLMKLLVGLMCLAFLVNLVVALMHPRQAATASADPSYDLLPLLAMIGTTFSVAGAFYQAYLVKEKGWNITDARKGLVDSIASITVLGLMTLVILLTAWWVFYGLAEPVALATVGDVARQLEPLFGPAARLFFSVGILAGAASSFLVNALIGGTVLSDSVGKGARLQDRWPVHFTAVALLVGMSVAIASFSRQGSTVLLITFAQALTVLGIPALAAALIYLGTRPELMGERKIPKPILGLAALGFVVSLVLAGLTASKVIDKLA